MKGFPKHLNTRADYEYVRDNFPAEQWGPAWQSLLDTRFSWLPASGAEPKGIELREVEQDGQVVGQEAWVEDKNAKIFRLGFTVAEVQKALEG